MSLHEEHTQEDETTRVLLWGAGLCNECNASRVMCFECETFWEPLREELMCLKCYEKEMFAAGWKLCPLNKRQLVNIYCRRIKE